MNNFDETRIEDFIMSLSMKTDNDILKLKKYAKENEVPIIRDETRDFIISILNIKEPKEILEIGTAIGYSTTIMHKTCPNAKITTIEDFAKRIKEAHNNLDSIAQIELIEQDANIYLKNNNENEKFDFIFLDAAKGQYINWLSDIKRLMKKRAILIADNIFKDGEILESKFLIKKRDRTIHKRMREYLHTICNDIELETKIFNIGDGVSISIKK